MSVSKLYLLDTDCTDPYENLAREQSLASNLTDEEFILYLWQNEPSVIIGYNQLAENECDLKAIEKDEIHLVRRFSGGGAVYHDLGNLNFTFICSEKEYDEARQSSVIINALKKLGINAEKSGRNDLLIEGRKFSGHAYTHHDGKACHHGTIMVDVDLTALSRYLQVSSLKLAGNKVASVSSRVINLKQLKPDITIRAIKDAIAAQCSEEYALPLLTLKTSIEDEQQIREITQHLSSKEFIYGKSRQYRYCCQDRFNWGTVRIEYDSSDGIIQEAAVYTDALDEAYLAVTARQLKGASFGNLEKVLTDKQHAQINHDLIELLRRSYQHEI